MWIIIKTPFGKIFSKGYPNEMLNELILFIHPFVRKSAHFSEYFVLAVTVAFPLYVYKIRGIFLFLTGGIFCVFIAFLDEYQQAYISGRVSSFKDVGIDSLGILCGILCTWFLCYLGRKTIFGWLSLEKYRKSGKY